MLRNQVGLREGQLTESKTEKKKIEKSEKARLVEAYKLDPRNALCTLQMAVSFMAKDAHKATVFAKTALMYSKDSKLKARATAFLGRLAHSQNDFSTAKKHFEAALKMDTGSHEILFSLAQVHIKQGRIDSACQCLEKIISKNPSDYDTLTFLFALYSENSKYQEQAQNIFESLKKIMTFKADGLLDIQDPDVLAQVAKYFEKRNPTMARKCLQI